MERLPVVAAPADAAAGGTQNDQDDADHHKNCADGLQDGHADDQSNHKQHDAKDNHGESNLSWPNAGAVR